MKRYLALVSGKWKGAKQTVTAPLRKNVLQGGERMVRVDESGRLAVSVFTPVSSFQEASLVEVDLKTGRTHQIRVHGAHIGHPLAGDEKYGDPAFNLKMKHLGLRRMLLHAHYLEFMDGTNGEKIVVSAPLDNEMKAVIDRLESS